MAHKIISGIEKSKRETPFEKVLFAIGIRFVGEIAAKNLAHYFKNIHALADASVEDLSSVNGIGLVIAESVSNFFKQPQNQEFIQRLEEYGLQMSLSESELTLHSNILASQSIVISGVFSHHSRDEYKAMIEKNGGKNVGSISNKTSFVLAGANMGPAKLEKAQKLGVRVISEKEFLEMIHELKD